MRKLSLLLISFVFLLIPFTSQSEEAQVVEAKPAVYGILMYADWCGACKALDPKIAQAREEADLDSEDILFMRWDLTDETTKHQTLMMASVLGLNKVYAANAGKTGFMLLVDAETGEKLELLTTKYGPTEIADKIQNSIEAANS